MIPYVGCLFAGGGGRGRGREGERGVEAGGGEAGGVHPRHRGWSRLCQPAVQWRPGPTADQCPGPQGHTVARRWVGGSMWMCWWVGGMGGWLGEVGGCGESGWVGCGWVWVGR